MHICYYKALFHVTHVIKYTMLPNIIWFMRYFNLCRSEGSSSSYNSTVLVYFEIVPCWFTLR